jgi:hypothetical protein
MLSATYRQTARQEPDEVALKVDPSNRYLWRFNPRRLDAEQVRDALLAGSGELDAAAGGPAGDGNATRRSVYTMKKRNNPNELLRALDMPAGFASTAERQSTTTPTQALQFLNGDWLLARSRKLAGSRRRHRRRLAGRARQTAVKERARNGGRLSEETRRHLQGFHLRRRALKRPRHSADSKRTHHTSASSFKR